MNILHIISYNGKGGAETFVNDLMSNQKKSNLVNSVNILTFSNAYEEIPHFQDSDFNHFHLFVDKRKSSLNNYLNVFNFIIKILRSNKPDIINSHLLAPIYIYLLPYFFKKIKFFHTIHSQAENELGALKYSKYYFARLLYYRKVFLISISPTVKKSIFDLYALNSTLISNGAKFCKEIKKEVNGFFTSSGKKILLAVGHTRKVKNYELLINSFKKINKDSILIVLGSLVDNFKDYNIQFARKDNIYFEGSVNNVQDYMKIADFLCMTSFYEGMPITLLESKANGLIPIVTPVNGIVDIIKHDINGVISKDMTIDSYANAINYALSLESANLDIMASQSLKEFNEMYDINICSENYITFYRSLL